MAFSDDQLLAYNQKGLLPGPKETEGEFLDRVNRFLNSSYVLDDVCPESLQNAKDLYDIEPNWVQIEYTNVGLRFWEAAQVESDTKYFKFQLRKSFLHQSHYLGMYSKKEIITHEFSHVGRMAFPPSSYEEVFAFESSKKMRRWLGPIFSKPNESFTLIIMTSISILSDFLLGQNAWAYLFFKTLPLLYLMGLGLRLIATRLHYKRAANKLERLLKNPQKARYVLYRLTEEEIKRFSRWRLKSIQKYVKKQKELRWRVIQLAYFNSAA